MIVKTDPETRDCVIVLGAREAIELYGADAASIQDLRNELRDWLENELIFDDAHNPNLKSGV